LIVAADCFTVEVWTRRGLQRFMVLFFIELSTRNVDIAGIGAAANGLWMSQIGRNVTDAVDGILKDTGGVLKREGLGGMLNYYYRAAREVVVAIPKRTCRL